MIAVGAADGRAGDSASRAHVKRKANQDKLANFREANAPISHPVVAAIVRSVEEEEEEEEEFYLGGCLIERQEFPRGPILGLGIP